MRPLALCRLLASGLVLAGLAAGCSGAHEPTQREAPAQLAARPITDVPALLGQPIEQVRQRLGPTATLPPAYEDLDAYSRLEARVTDSVQAFNTGGLLLVASYDLRTRRVHDLLLLGRREDTLMRQATLHANSADYLVMPVFHSNQPGVLLGLRVIETSRD